MKKKLYLIMIIISMISLVACSSNENSSNEAVNEVVNENKTDYSYLGGSVEEIIKRGEIVLGTDATYPPYEWHEIIGTEDTIIGIDLEIAQRVADELGVKLTIKDMKFDGLLASLKVGDIDFIISGMVENEERAKAADFSDSYYQETQDILIRREDIDKYKSIEDLAGTKIGVFLGTIQQTYAEENFNAEVMAIPDGNNVVMELKNSTVDAVFVTTSVADEFVARNDDLVVVGLEIPIPNGAAIAVSKGNSELLEVMNKVVADLKEEGIVEVWFEEYTNYNN